MALRLLNFVQRPSIYITKSKACALIGQLVIFHLPICARQRKVSAVNSLLGEV